MSEKIQGLTVEVAADTTKLQTSIEAFNQKLNGSFSSLQAVRKGLKIDPKDINLLGQKQGILTKRIAETSTKLRMLKADQAAMVQFGTDTGDLAQEWEKVNTQINNTQTDLKYLIKDYQKTVTEMKRLELANGRIGRAGDWTTNASKKLNSYANSIKYASLATAGLLFAVGKIGFSANNAFSDVEKTVNGTKTELDNFKQDLLNMSGEVPRSFETLSQAMSLGGQLAVSKRALTDFTRTVTDLEVATNLTTEEAATMMAQFKNIVNMPEKDYQRLASTVVHLGNNSATTEKDIMNMLMRISAGAKNAGFTTDQMVSISAALASVGLEAEAGGSAMTKFFNKTSNAVNRGGQELKDFTSAVGLDAKKFAETWKKEPAEALQMFFDSMAKSKKEGKPIIEMLDELGIKEVRMRDTLTRLANNPAVLSKSLKTGSKGWKENTALIEEATRKYETFQAKATIALNKLKIVAIKAFDKMSPVLSDWMDKGISAIDGFENAIDKLSPGQLTAITTALAGMVALYPTLKLLSFGLGGVGKAMFAINKIRLAYATKDLTLLALTTKNLSLSGGAFDKTLKGMNTALDGTTKASGKATGPLGKILGIVTKHPIAFGAAAAGLVILTAAFAEAKQEHEENVKGYRDLASSLGEVKSSADETAASIEELQDVTKEGKEESAQNEALTSKYLPQLEKIKSKYQELREEAYKIKDTEEKTLELLRLQTAEHKERSKVLSNSFKEKNKLEGNDFDYSKENMSVQKDGRVNYNAWGRSKDEIKALDQLIEYTKDLNAEEKALMISRQGIVTMFDGNYYYKGANITKQIVAGVKGGLSKEEMIRIKSEFGSSLDFKDGEFFYKGQKVSLDFAKGMSPEQIRTQVDIIKNMTKNGLDVDLSPEGMKAISTYSKELGKIDFSKPNQAIDQLKALLDRKDISPEARKLINGYVRALEKNAHKSKKGGEKLADNAEKGASTGSGFGLGNDFADGYILGIRAREVAAEIAGFALGKAAERGTKKGQNSSSPSKVAIGLGLDFGDGYAIGIEQSNPGIASAAKSLVRTLTNTVQSNVKGNTVARIIGENTVKQLQNARDAELSKVGLSASEKEAIKKYWDEKIAEETKNYKRQVETLKREEATNKKVNTYEKRISKAETYYNNYKNAKNEKDRKKWKKLFKAQTGYSKVSLANLNKYKSKQNNLIGKAQDNLEIQQSIADTNYEIADLKEDQLESTKQAIEEEKKLKQEAMNNALEKILNNNVLVDVMERFMDMMSNVSYDTTPATRAITQNSSQTINNSPVLNVTVNKLASDRDEDDLIDRIKLELGGAYS